MCFSLGSCGLRCVNKGGKSRIQCNLIPGYKATKGENFERGCRLSIGTVCIHVQCEFMYIRLTIIHT